MPVGDIHFPQRLGKTENSIFSKDKRQMYINHHSYLKGIDKGIVYSHGVFVKSVG